MTLKLQCTSRKVKLALVAVLMMLGGIFAVTTAAPASAGGPIVWTSINGGSVPMFWGTRNWSGVKAWEPNSSRFQMICYVDDQWYYGNYWSNRWFWGQDLATGDTGNVPASYVYYQVWVPHC